MDYTRGYTAAFYADIVDPVSWLDLQRVEIIAGSVSRTDTDLRQTAQLTVRDFDPDRERWIRIYMDARQNENVTHIPLFTGLASNPKDNIDGAVRLRPLECYSVLEPLKDIKLQRGWYLPAGTNGARALRQLMTATPAPFRTEGDSPDLQDFIIAENGESNLTMVDKILKAISWRIRIEGDGTIIAGPEQQEVAATFSATEADIIEKALTIDHDWFSCPNVVRVTSGNLTAVARDDSPDSPLSTVNRGREVILQEDDIQLATDEGIGQYAERRLKEEQNRVEKAQYSRRFWPDVNIGSLVKINYEQIRGLYTVTDQTIGLTYAAQTSESVKLKNRESKAEDFTPKPLQGRILLPGDNYFVMPDGNYVTVPIMAR